MAELSTYDSFLWVPAVFDLRRDCQMDDAMGGERFHPGIREAQMRRRLPYLLCETPERLTQAESGGNHGAMITDH